MKTIVTGCAGFIGSHLCERLLDDGHLVLGIDDLSSGSKANMESFQIHRNFKFMQMDLSIETPVVHDIDWVFHLSGKADVVPSIETPLRYYEANVTATINMLEMARHLGTVKKFVYAASSSCYGIPSKYPTGESAHMNPQYPYALTKLLAEQAVLHWSKIYKIPAVSLRLFNVYGPRSRTSGAYGAVFGVFLSQLYHRSPFTVVGDGSQSRDFTFVTDVVDAFVKAAETDYKTENVFNVGSSNPQTINRLVELLDATNQVVHLPYRPGEPRKTYARCSKITRWLGWEPKVSFEQGVEIMKRHINHYKDAPLWDKDKIALATRTWFKYLGR